MMNKRPIRAVFILLGAMLFCVILFRFGPKILLKREETSLDQTNKAFIVSGDVRIKKAKDGTGWQKLESSTVLEKGDMVKTAAGSTVDISIGKNTDKAVKIAEKSTVGFEGINPTSLNFSEGKILVALKKLEPKSSFVVKTPTAICGARGTGWLEEAGPEKTRVCVFDSQVFMNKLDANGRPERGKHIAGEGTQAVISKDGPISESQTIGEGDLQDWRYWRKNIEFLRDGKMLVNDFDRKENFNNLGAAFGSWTVFYSDPNQY